jgi:hypothetical protein
MSDQIASKDPGRIWRDQPEEKLPLNLTEIVRRRTEELASRSRSEILVSVAAALLLVGVMSWRLQVAREGLLQLGFAAAIAWACVALYVLRRRIRRQKSLRADAFAATCLEYYRNELRSRRDHLRNEWLWHGPLFFGVVLFAAVLTGRSNVAFQPVRNLLPLLILLAGWTGFGIWRRRRQAREIQREIDDLSRPSQGPAGTTPS